MGSADGFPPGGKAQDGSNAPGSGAHTSPAADIAALDARLRAARAGSDEAAAKEVATLRSERGASGLAWRLAVELLVGPLVGGLLGWQIDQWLGTRPWGLIVMLILGVAAGLNLAIKAARQMNRLAGTDGKDG